MRTATAKDLRQKTAALLEEVRRGQLITYRGKSIAVHTPVEKAQRKTLHPAGFGIWRDRKDMRSVEKWLSSLRPGSVHKVFDTDVLVWYLFTLVSQKF